MDSDSLHARIEHEVAELRGAYPWITTCHTALRNWSEGAQPRYSLWLDVRWAQHQSIISGPTCGSSDEAVRAGFAEAREQLEAGARQ